MDMSSIKSQTGLTERRPTVKEVEHLEKILHWKKKSKNSNKKFFYIFGILTIVSSIATFSAFLSSEKPFEIKALLAILTLATAGLYLLKISKKLPEIKKTISPNTNSIIQLKSPISEIQDGSNITLVSVIGVPTIMPSHWFNHISKDWHKKRNLELGFIPTSLDDEHLSVDQSQTFSDTNTPFIITKIDQLDAISEIEAGFNFDLSRLKVSRFLSYLASFFGFIAFLSCLFMFGEFLTNHISKPNELANIIDNPLSKNISTSSLKELPNHSSKITINNIYRLSSRYFNGPKIYPTSSEDLLIDKDQIKSLEWMSVIVLGIPRITESSLSRLIIDGALFFRGYKNGIQCSSTAPATDCQFYSAKEATSVSGYYIIEENGNATLYGEEGAQKIYKKYQEEQQKAFIISLFLLLSLLTFLQGVLTLLLQRRKLKKLKSWYKKRGINFII